MIEELRTYLLNSRKYSSDVYMSEEYQPILLNSRFSEFRDIILGSDLATDPRQQIYRANFWSEEIYRHRLLGKIAAELFDSRTVENKFKNTSFEPEILISVSHPSLFISAIPNAIYETEVVDQNIIISPTGTLNKVSVEVITSFYSLQKDVIFEFIGNVSSFFDIPRTPLRFAFSGTPSVPLNLSKNFIKIKYPYYLNISSIIDRYKQVNAIDFFILGNKTASQYILPVYSSFVRDHERLLSLILAYAISLKFQ
jgi:hypothetical protein